MLYKYLSTTILNMTDTSDKGIFINELMISTNCRISIKNIPQNVWKLIIYYI